MKGKSFENKIQCKIYTLILSYAILKYDNTINKYRSVNGEISIRNKKVLNIFFHKIFAMSIPSN